MHAVMRQMMQSYKIQFQSPPGNLHLPLRIYPLTAAAILTGYKLPDIADSNYIRPITRP